MTHILQQVLVHPAIGLDKNGEKVAGFYFEVSGAGTSGSGRAKNVQVFEKLQELLNDTGKGVYVSSLQAGHYKSKGTVHDPKSTANDPFHQLEKLKELFDRGVITKEDYDAKKKELLDRM